MISGQTMTDLQRAMNNLWNKFKELRSADINEDEAREVIKILSEAWMLMDDYIEGAKRSSKND